MSKLEEALAKANQMRKSDYDDRSDQLNSYKKIDTAVVELKEVNNAHIVTISQPDSQVAEEYRRLKSMVLRETKADFLNTIMVTSSIDSEGKTLTAINLAVSLAQEIDHSILLVDADLRKPMIHEYLGIKYKYGLSDYLTGDIDVSEILIKTGIGKLTILPAGRRVENPVELISSKRMKSLIKELKQRYMDRYIIIDTPPILSFAEGISIGSYVDGIIFVVQQGRAQKKTIENSLNVIKGLNILGVVFNNSISANLEGHYSYYYNYQKKGKDETA